ncbi:hypothetical protein H6G91_39920 [Nostoc muscorum FACHB-395]|nr:hypothetical protein [Desmonostoc muscorum FACHB-395]
MFLKLTVQQTTGFHSISIPSEWEFGIGGEMRSRKHSSEVSIQLISPASGNAYKPTRAVEGYQVSIQLVSPASGNLTMDIESIV